MASLIAKKKGNQLYYYVVESARVDGQPRIVHQSYLGSAEKVAALVRDRTAPVPLSATMRDFGLPGALWLAAQQTGVLQLLQQLWPQPRSGPSTAHYLLLAAIHRVCQPGPKTEVADWYGRTVLQPLWGFAAERFTSQAFWDCFEALAPEQPSPGTNDELERAQLRLIGLWKQKQLVSRRLLGYDTTNFYTYIASTNTQNHLAQRGHNKQGRHNLRQVGLSYVLDGEHGLSVRAEVKRQQLRRRCCWRCHRRGCGRNSTPASISLRLGREAGSRLSCNCAFFNCRHWEPPRCKIASSSDAVSKDCPTSAR